jgi:hypothetical protein
VSNLRNKPKMSKRTVKAIGPPAAVLPCRHES